jgi:thiamine biosynthesis lipoprotein
MTDSLNVKLLPGDIHSVGFSAMASPCEILVASSDSATALKMGQLAQAETLRIESKFSRYRADSALSKINHAKGEAISVDPETAVLLDFAQQCFQLSGGLFDITSGILRRVWKFDCSDKLPQAEAIAALLPLLGFDKLQWDAPNLTMPEGMELDFGGIGKEYAVDSVMRLLASRFDVPMLVNFGGDLCANRAPSSKPWQVGIERPESNDQAALVLELSSGALATSGDTQRFLFSHGIRYSHILDPHTGWPVPNAPRSVTVAAATCMEAGMLATFSLLQGANAREFLAAQGTKFWCLD